MERPSAFPGRPDGLVLARRVGLIVVLVAAATWGAHELREALSLRLSAPSDTAMRRMMLVGLLAYTGLLAIPFVPGAEIGIALLTAFGASVAPLVYGATIFAMALAYALGRLLPVRILAWFLWTLRLRRAAAMVSRAAQMSHAERVDLLLEGAPSAVVALALRHRYLALAIVVNLPGNVLIGGGGGIMMMAGLSRIFAPLPTLGVVVLAVLPVPLAVALTGL